MNKPSQHGFHLDSPDQLTEKLAKLREYQESLKGKAVQMAKMEEQLKAKEIKLLEYRKQILEALRQLLLEEPSIAENKNLMKKYDELLDNITEDVKDDFNELMG